MGQGRNGGKRRVFGMYKKPLNCKACVIWNLIKIFQRLYQFLFEPSIFPKPVCLDLQLIFHLFDQNQFYYSSCCRINSIHGPWKLLFIKFSYCTFWNPILHLKIFLSFWKIYYLLLLFPWVEGFTSCRPMFFWHLYKKIGDIIPY